jgi:hypothetical protein
MKGTSMSYRLRSGVSTAQTDAGMALLDERNGDYFTLNPTGVLVLEALLAGGVPDDAVDRLMVEYEIDRVTATRDVTDLVEALESAKLLARRS